MVIDTSALVAWFEQEPDAARIAERLEQADELSVSAVTLVEAGIVLEARRGEAAGRELDLFIHRLGVKVVAVDEDQAEIARAAYRQFGKGRHAAALNFGDCFSYALAVISGQPLLVVGDDFAKTDIAAA